MRPVAFVLLAMVGCSATPLTDSQPIEVVMRPAVDDGAPAVRVEVTNHGDQPILITGCSYFIQRRVGSGWQGARSGSCTGTVVDIAPGETRGRSFAAVRGGIYRPGIGYRFFEGDEPRFAYGSQRAW